MSAISDAWRVRSAYALIDMIRDRGSEISEEEESLNFRRIEMLNLVLSETDALELAAKLIGAML